MQALIRLSLIIFLGKFYLLNAADFDICSIFTVCAYISPVSGYQYNHSYAIA